MTTKELQDLLRTAQTVSASIGHDDALSDDGTVDVWAPDLVEILTELLAQR